MADSEKKIDDKKGDEVLRRMLKTPPEPKTLPSRSVGRRRSTPIRRGLASRVLRMLGVSAWDAAGIPLAKPVQFIGDAD